MSTLTVCPHCGDATRFDAMRAHLDSCAERSPLIKSRQSSPAKFPATADVKPLSGLDFYNQLNKLSRLARPSRSASADRNGRFSASPLRDEAAVVQRLMYPPTSLTIDVAPSHSPMPVEAPRQPSPSWAAVSALSPPAPPSIQVNLRSRSRESHASSKSGGVLERPASAGGHSAASSLSPSLASSSALGRAPSGSHYATANGAAAAAAGRGTTSRGASNRGQKEALSALPGFGGAVDAASLPHARPQPSARRNTAAGVAAEQESGLPSTIAGLSQNTSMHGGALGHDSSTAQHCVPRTSESSVASSAASSRRRAPQQSSFAIRLRGDPAAPTAHTRAGATRFESAAGDGGGGASPSTTVSVMQLQASLRQVQQMLRQQQAQYSALLQAHGDLHRQVAAQQGAHGSLLRRSMDQATAVEAALAQHSGQWRREQAAVQESVSSLWAAVSEIHERLHSVAVPSPAKALTAPLAAQRAVAVAASAPSTPQGRPSRHDASTHRSPLERSARGGAGISELGSGLRHRQVTSTTSAFDSGAGRRHEAAATHIHVQQRSTAGAATQESAYYSDLASFIHADATAASSLQASLLSHKPVADPSFTRQTLARAAALDAAADGGGERTCTPASFATAPIASSYRPGWVVPQPAAVSAPAPQALPYAMDVQQQQSRLLPRQQHTSLQSSGSVEDRVIAKLRTKPTVVVQHCPWR